MNIYVELKEIICRCIQYSNKTLKLHQNQLIFCSQFQLKATEIMHEGLCCNSSKSVGPQLLHFPKISASQEVIHVVYESFLMYRLCLLLCQHQNYLFQRRKRLICKITEWTMTMFDYHLRKSWIKNCNNITCYLSAQLRDGDLNIAGNSRKEMQKYSRKKH